VETPNPANNEIFAMACREAKLVKSLTFNMIVKKNFECQGMDLHRQMQKLFMFIFSGL